MTEHTPTPWKAEHRPPNMILVFAGENPGMRPAACMCDGDQEANAAFIVKAVNKHADLVQALQALVDNVNDYERVNNLAPSPGRTECWDTVAHAKAVLSRVGQTLERGK